ncbi:MFS transporter [Niabella yanshanensis]|uniref:MFS transporter n=1 Tax=Niabella yanshanensis TaxID=577386 RepID=A0ABZ0WBC5_9BACT|nr:MFS transporter [Niabella yanshanensis]WQD40598.1 MFS transporter [Niabella yanshanensis]
MNKKLFSLALGGLAIGTTEFIIMGLMQDVATSLQISIPKAGYLISAYAIGVIVGAPLLVAASVKYSPKKVLMAMMVLFTVFNGLSAAAPGFYSLIVARFFSGLPHGAFFGIGAVVASKMAKEGKQAQAISMMFAGLTVANLAMVPLVTYLGHELGWRFAFLVVALIGLLTIFFIKIWLPPIQLNQQNSIKDELQFFKTPKAWLIILITAIGFGGLFAWFSYISPLMTHVSGFSIQSVSYIMLIAGAGMVAGNLIGGIMADKMRPEKAAAILFISLVVALIAVFFFSENQTASLILTFICGLLAMAVGSPINILMIRAAEKSAMMGAAFMQAAFNMANSIGAYFGGLPIALGLGYNYPSFAGAIMAFVGFLLSITFMMRYGSARTSKDLLLNQQATTGC